MNSTRTGAGTPPQPQERSITIRISVGLLEQVDEVTASMCLPGEKPKRAVAIRRLLRLGLIALAEQESGGSAEPDQEDEGEDESGDEGE